ncbi:MAG TPA: hypothetical protein VKB75_01500 [Jatrophihabitans sp.]|nr:hypothetical protein [Jatrophihabitans sp.]
MRELALPATLMLIGVLWLLITRALAASTREPGLGAARRHPIDNRAKASFPTASVPINSSDGYVTRREETAG